MRLFPKNIVVIPTIKVAEKTSQKGLFFLMAITASARLPPTLSIPWSLSGSLTVINVIECMSMAVIPAIEAKTINPILSSSPPTQKIIGKAKRAIRFVPVWAPNILKPVKLVLSRLSEVILGVRDENGTLTNVKQVLWSKFANKRKKNSEEPSRGGTQNSKTNDKAKGILPNNKYGR